MKLLIASNNKHKISEIQRILNEKFPGKYEILSPADLSINLDVVEDADTLEGNAELKARAFFDKAQIPVIADDTGLEIDALDGRPGVYSARFAGEDVTYADNRRKALELLANIPDKKRTARFRTVICYFDGKRKEFIEGRCDGKIIFEDRGDAGFGYDQIFMPDGYDRTFAEMSADEKNAISHRGRAVRNFADWLDSNF
jgi:XTP/dITP diphosphohydrolase